MNLVHEVVKGKFDFIFIILCYRNTHDLQLFLETASKLSDRCKFIVVNSYYDDETQRAFEAIALRGDCDFINVPNKGYGAGNNRGIEYAVNKYEFDYLVVCNPDIEFLSFSKSHIENMTDCIIAPEIKTLTGKAQNPFMSHNNWLFEWIEFYGYKTNFKPLLYAGFAFNKILREISNAYHRFAATKKRRIYASHGSCIIFGNEVLRKIELPFDENMFLFCEEYHLAKLAQERKIPTYLIPELKIMHREDGSVSFLNEKIFNIQKESFIYYYMQWNGKSKVME